MRSLVCLFILAFLNVSPRLSGFLILSEDGGGLGTGFLYLCQKIFKFSNGFFNTNAAPQKPPSAHLPTPFARLVLVFGYECVFARLFCYLLPFRWAMCVSYFFFNFYFRFLAAASWPHGAGKLGKSQRAQKNSQKGQLTLSCCKCNKKSLWRKSRRRKSQLEWKLWRRVNEWHVRRWKSTKNKDLYGSKN